MFNYGITGENIIIYIMASNIPLNYIMCGIIMTPLSSLTQVSLMTVIISFHAKPCLTKMNYQSVGASIIIAFLSKKKKYYYSIPLIVFFP